VEGRQGEDAEAPAEETEAVAEEAAE